MVKIIWSFAASAPSSPFQVPARSLSIFAACASACAGNIPISATATVSATNVAICRREILCTGLVVCCLSIFCFILWRKTPPDFFQRAFRSLWLRVQASESSRGWVFVVKVFLEAFLREPGADKLIHLRARQRPRQLPFRLVRLPPPDDRQQFPSRPHKPRDFVNRLHANLGRQRLHRIGFENKIKLPFPFRRRLKQICHSVFHSALWKSLLRHSNGCLRNIKCRRFESPIRQLLCVVAQPARNH